MIMNSEASTASETSTGGAGGANCCGANANCTSLKRDCPSSSVYKRTYLTTGIVLPVGCCADASPERCSDDRGAAILPEWTSRGSRTYPAALGVEHSRSLGSSCPAPRSSQCRRQLLSSRPVFGLCPRVLLGPFMRRSRLYRAGSGSADAVLWTCRNCPCFVEPAVSWAWCSALSSVACRCAMSGHWPLVEEVGRAHVRDVPQSQARAGL